MCFLLIIYVFVCTGFFSSSAIAAVEISYDDFVEIDVRSNLAKEIQRHQYLYLSKGTYIVDNPIVINKEGSLFIHGGDRISTKIVPMNPTKPLFIVKSVEKLNISGVKLSVSKVIDGRVLLFENTRRLDFEMLDGFIDGGVLDIRGPGIYRLQATYVNNRGRNIAPIIIDHPEAELIAVGGNMTTGRGGRVLINGDDIYNVWQKRGRLRLYGVGVQYSIGRADFRIDSHSDLGAHVIAFARSEGTNGYRLKDLSSALLFVPESNEKVDVLLVANAGQWPLETRDKNHLVNYNAAGNLWMLGNASQQSDNILALGNADDATVTAIGNRIFSRANPLPIKAKIIYEIGNTYSHQHSTGDKKFPYARFIEPPSSIENYSSIPAIPIIPIPSPLHRPVLNRALSGMIDVKRDFGAKGDGVSDDTLSLQRAFTSGNQIYMPEGVYITTQPLGYSHSQYGKTAMKAGGWLAGAGKEKTVIRRIHSNHKKNTVFTSEGLGYFTVQGITFELLSSKNVEYSDPVVQLEFNPLFNGAFATQEVIFYDCSFNGGKYAVSVGLETGTMGSENMFINSTFMNSGIGLAIGSYNALNNIVYGSEFVGNTVTVGHDSDKKTGGNAALIHVDIIETSSSDLQLSNTSGEPWYFNNVNSKTKSLFTAGNSSIPYQLVFERCNFEPEPGAGPYIKNLSGGGLYFLGTDIKDGDIDISSRMSAIPLISIYSKIKGINDIKLGDNGRLYQIK